MERHTKILELVNSEKKIEVTALSELLGVSQVTIRKDLELLSKKGLLRREHGYALINSSEDITTRLVSQFDLKRSIAKRAAQMVSDGECIMIESGSSCTLLAEEVVNSKKDVTIVTNSSFIAAYIREAPYCSVVLLGGEYQKASQATVGPIARMNARHFSVDKLFIGIDGYDPDRGFTGSDLMRSEVIQAMSEAASNTIIITDSSKFNKRGLVPLFPLSTVQTLITDSGITGACRTLLEHHHIQVIIV